MLKQSYRQESELTTQIVQAIADNNLQNAFIALEQLAQNSQIFPPKWLRDTAKAISTGNWGLLSFGFVEEEFVGKNGYFLIIGLYGTSRGGGNDRQLTAILGQILPLPEPSVKKAENVLSELFGRLPQEFPRVLGYRTIIACRNAGNESGEAFLVPNGWQFSNNGSGLALNDMKEQRRRFLDSGRLCLAIIFEPQTAKLLLASLEDEFTGNCFRHLEYQIHDYAHATGLGLELKRKHNLFPCYWYGGVEEWRADGVEFELLARLFPQEQAGQMIAVNFCARFALDAHRQGGIDRDGDVNASLLSLNSLFRSEAICIKNGQLALRDPSYQGLVKALEFHRAEAINLTRQELNLDHPTGIFRLYGSIKLDPAIKEIFQGLVVDPCREFWRSLR